jgi:tryptophan 2,3-dioxygenase
MKEWNPIARRPKPPAPLPTPQELEAAALEAIRSVLDGLAAIDKTVGEAIGRQHEQAAAVAKTLEQALARVARIEEEARKRDKQQDARDKGHEKALLELARVIDRAAGTLKETAEKLVELKDMAKRPTGWRFEFDRNQNGVILGVDALAKEGKR